jgi:hypothetical protein
MEIIAKFITPQNLKGLKSMSITSKIPDWESSYSNFRKTLMRMELDEIESLLDIYIMMSPLLYKLEIKAISDELELRKSSLGKELC